MPADGDTKGKTAPDQPSAPRNGRWPERGGARALRTIVLGLLPVVGIVVVGYVRFTTSQRAYVITSGYRALATGGRLVSARLDGLARELDRTHGKIRGFKSVLRPVPVCASSKATLLLRTSSQISSTSIFRVLDNSGQVCIKYNWRDTASSLDVGPTSWNAAVSDLLPLSALGRVFDVVLVADEAGSVVLPPANDGVVLHHLDELQPVQSPAPKSGTDATPPPSWKTAFTEPVQLLHLGQTYEVLCQPIHHPLPNSDQHLVLCGMMLAQKLTSRARAIPPMLLALAASLVVGTVIAWPALKLRFMAPSERLEAADVRLLVLSCLAGVGTATFVVGCIYAHYDLTQRLDDQARAFAARFQRHLSRDLCSAATQLATWRLAVEKKPDVFRDARPEQGCPFLPAELPDLTTVAAVDGGGKVLASCALDLEGKLAATVPPAQPVSDRAYFTDARESRLWALDGCHEHFAVESVRTRSDGTTSLVVAQPTKALGVSANPDGGVVPGDGTVLVATALRAAFDPVLPPGFGFAVVDDDGKVLLHSDRTRNLEENLVQECDGDARLRSAILRHRSIALDVPYYGRPYRLVVEPLAQMPWTLVVFRDRSRLADVTALIGLSWIVLFGGYFLVYLLALAGVGILRPGYRAAWLWPDPNRIADYHRASALLAVLGVGCLLGTIGSGGLGDVPLLAGVPLAALAIVYLLLFRPDADECHRRVAVVALVVAGALIGGALAVRLGWWSLLYVVPVASLRHARLRQVVFDRVLPGHLPPSPDRLRRSFVTMLLILQLVIGAWPAVVLLKDARAQSVERLVKRAQLDFLHNLTERADRLRARRPPEQAKEIPDVDDPQKSDAVADVYGSALLAKGLVVAPDTASCPSAPVRPEWRADPIGRLVYIVFCGLSETPLCDETLPVLRRQLAGLALPTLPSIDPGDQSAQSATLPLMGYDQASDGVWCWTRAGSALTLRVSDPRLRMRVAPGAPDRPLLIHAYLPSIRLPDGPLALLAWLIVSGIGIGLLWVLLRFAVVRLFLLEPPGHDAPQSSLSAAPGAIRAWVFVAPRATDFNAVVSDTSALLVDLRAASGPADCRLTEERRGRTVVIDHLEARLTNPEWSTAVLALLERLVFADRAKVVVLSEIDPLAFLSGQFAASEPTDSEAREIVERFWRWVQLFAACDLHVEEPAGDPTAPGIARQQLAAKRRITETAASSGDAAYWRIWSQSTKAEKLALSQLAREGFLNPNNRAVATRLMERGLVVRGPAFELFHPGFRQFVLRAEAPRDVLDWEQEKSGHGWARIQIPFLVAMVVIVGFFFLTQPQMYSVAIALLGALTTAVPLVLQLIGFFGRQRTAGGGG